MQHSTDKDLVDELGLVLSNREKQAHDARHLAAQGKDDEVDVEWIRDLKLLRVRFHRGFLAMTGANHEYYDYFARLAIRSGESKNPYPTRDIPARRAASIKPVQALRAGQISKPDAEAIFLSVRRLNVLKLPKRRAGQAASQAAR